MKSVNVSLESFNTRHREHILSGQEEGAAGWITTNYLDGKLRRKYVSVFVCVSFYQSIYVSFSKRNVK